MDTDSLRQQFGFGSRILSANVDGIGDEESLRTPPAGGNCLNWIVGHLLDARLNALRLVGEDEDEPAVGLDQAELYVYQARVPWDESEAHPLSKLVEAFRATQEPLERGLDGMTPEDLAQPVNSDSEDFADETVGSMLAILAFHEAYHLGQTGLSRRLLGHANAIAGPEPRPRES